MLFLHFPLSFLSLFFYHTCHLRCAFLYRGALVCVRQFVGKLLCIQLQGRCIFHPPRPNTFLIKSQTTSQLRSMHGELSKKFDDAEMPFDNKPKSGKRKNTSHLRCNCCSLFVYSCICEANSAGMLMESRIEWGVKWKHHLKFEWGARDPNEEGIASWKVR